MTPEETSQAPLDILVVDDDVQIAKVLSFHVKKAAPTAVIRERFDGESALLAAQTRMPDLIFLDLNMPRMTGMEATMMLRGAGLPDTCTIIAVSAGAQKHDAKLLGKLGVDTLIEKGGSFGPLIAKAIRDVEEKRARGATPPA